jgi:hypothetical protein
MHAQHARARRDVWHGESQLAIEAAHATIRHEAE